MAVRKSLLFLGLLALVHPAFPAGKPNIVLISLESVRADRVGFLGAKSKITPNLDALAAQGIVFQHAYTQAPTTVVSEATILTGTYPQSHKMTEFADRLSASVPFMPEILRARGYHTAAFVGTIELDPRAGDAPGFERGFERYDAGFTRPTRGKTSHQTVRRNGAEVAARAASWLSVTQSPFFVWVQLSDADISTAGSYNSGLTAADSAVGKLVASLRAKKMFDDTIIVVVGDHGQSLGAHGEDAHGVFLYEETVCVPLVLKLPSSYPGRAALSTLVKAKASLVSVASSLFEAAGIPVPSQMQGQSLLRLAKGTALDQPVYSRSDFSQQAFGMSLLESWRANKYLYIRAPQPELYDLTVDPDASHNLATSAKATLDTMAGQLASFSQHFDGSSTKAGLTSAEMQKLASLGYVGLQKTSSTATTVAGIDPKDQVRLVNKILEAKALNEDGKPERASGILQHVIGETGKMYLAQYTMGESFFELQQYAKAIEYLHKAIELQPNSTWAHYEMGASLIKTGDYKTAVVHLEIAASRLEQFPEAHNLLAEAYEHSGKTEEAKRERKKFSVPR
jgi:arylsulfatase A-like enzyme/Tfp pilus assembly protein PilF